MKKLIALLLVGVISMINFSNNFYAINCTDEILRPSISMLANQCLTVNTTMKENYSIEKRITNIGEFREGLLKHRLTPNKIQTAKTIYRYLGKDEDYINRLPEDKLLEALTIEDCVETTNYIKYQENGTQTYLSEEQLVSELSNIGDDTQLSGKARILLNDAKKSYPHLQSNEAIFDDETRTISNDGYLSLTTTSYRTTGKQPGRSYYLIEAKANWLKEPFFKFEDVLAVTSNATFDNDYNNYGYYHQTTIIDNCYYEYFDNYIYKNTGASNPDYIKFEYSAGIGGIVLRFDMRTYNLSGSTAHKVDYATMEAFVRYKVSLNNNDGGVQAAYGHKQAGVGGISVSLSTGSIGLSVLLGKVAEYYGEPLSIYTYK